MKKNKIEMNLPTFVGELVLDLSKILTYDFYYDCMIPKWSKKQ